MTIILRDQVQLELKAGIDDEQTTVTFLAAEPPYNDPPQPGSGEEVELILTDRLSSPSKIEKLTATAIVDNAGDWECTVTRGTPAHAFDAGAVAILSPTKALFDELRAGYVTGPGGGLIATSPDGSVEKIIGIDNSGNVVTRDP
jgi:hypothetical protein